jgi:chemotaxis protein methyltransferase CheR
MLQAETPAPTGRVELFASDLSERLLDRAQAGVYSSFEVQRGLSARQLVRHFENRDEHFQLAKRVRQEVRWRRVNLLDDLTALGGFDIVLCRYVLNGFTQGARSQTTAKLASLVAPGGALVLGEEEPLALQGFTPGGASGVFVRTGEARANAA